MSLTQAFALWVVLIAPISRRAFVAVMDLATVISREPPYACPHAYIAHHNRRAPVVAAGLFVALALNKQGCSC
jgi:hypothetical protein